MYEEFRTTLNTIVDKSILNGKTDNTIFFFNINVATHVECISNIGNNTSQNKLLLCSNRKVMDEHIMKTLTF